MKASVVIPTYNRRHLISQAIDSALAQGEALGEVVVVDDASTDGTLAWLEQAYAGQPVRGLPNVRAKGPAGGRNTGMQAAQGEFIALLDSDDQFLPGHLDDALQAFARHPDLDVVFGRARYERAGVPEDYMGPNFERKLAAAPQSHASDDVIVFGPDFFDHLLAFGCWFNLSSVVMRRSAAQALMNEQLRISEDYEFWVRLSRTHRFGCLLRPQIRYALHDENISFEADATTAAHAPRLLQALEIMRAYPGLDTKQQGLLEMQMADVLFSWGYRSRCAGDLGEAAKLYWRAGRLGRRRDALGALLKLPLAALLPSRAAAARRG